MMAVIPYDILDELLRTLDHMRDNIILDMIDRADTRVDNDIYYCDMEDAFKSVLENELKKRV